MAETRAPTPMPVVATRAPDFSALALEHLAQRCDTFRQHVREHLERPAADAPFAALGDDLRRFRNTLVLLERAGAVYVVEELLTLLDVRADGGIETEEAFARVLVSAGERLGDHVERLRRDTPSDAPTGAGVSDGALSLLPLVNDSRACRDAPSLSEALVLAAGVAVPTAAPTEGEAADDSGGARAAFVARARALHPRLVRDLLAWFRSVPGTPPAVPMPAFDELAALCEAPSLAHLEPLLDGAAVLVEALRDGRVADGTAPRRLFAQLERTLHAIVSDGAFSVPDAAYRDLLYYVALIEPSTPRVAALHRRFGLERIGPLARETSDAATSARTASAPEALGTRLAAAIRDSIDAETAALRQWLEQAPTAADHPHVLRLRERLVHVEPVLTLLGARAALSSLRRINAALGALATDAPVGAAERLALAESLLRLDRALDEHGMPVTVLGAPGADALATATRGTDAGMTDAAGRAALASATDACLREARRRLVLVGDALQAPSSSVGIDADEQLRLTERALTLLPLSDVQPLLRGLRTANARLDATAPVTTRDTLATLVASLEFYLGCVLQGDTAGSRRLLHEAEAALVRLGERISATPRSVEHDIDDGYEDDDCEDDGYGDDGHGTSGERATVPVARMPGASRSEPRGTTLARDTTDVDDTAADEAAGEVEPTHEALARMDRIGAVLASRTGEGITAATLRPAFDALADVAVRGGIDGMRELATAAAGLLGRLERTRGGATALSADELALFEEAHAVLPQLIERMHGNSEGVRGLDLLVQDLCDAEPVPAAPSEGRSGTRSATPRIGEEAGTERAGEGAGTGSGAGPGDGAGSGVRIVDGRDDVFDDSTSETLDETLQEVFRRECATHIGTLAQAVSAALPAVAPGGSWSHGEEPERLPSDAMLRALHTLSGSAQTVDARHIVAVVQPLQRVALARHRADRPFDGAETRYIGELVDVLRARLGALEEGDGSAVPTAVLDVEARLPTFVAGALAERDGVRGRVGEGGRDEDTRSIDSVFDEEARELLARLQRAAATATVTGRSSDEDVAIDRALGLLHTLKGSARMAGRTAVAEHAHALEGLVQDLEGHEARRRALAVGRRELQSLLLDTAPRPAGPSPPGTVASPSVDPAELRDAASVPAATFESLLTLATDVTVSQARLSDDIARVREICRDLESAAGRWRRLPHEAPLLESPAAREMLADLDTARRGLSDALRLADVEQQHASRAASSLQQTLIRTRLVRVEELRERLSHTVRDAAEAVGRQARLVVEGGDVTLDGALCRQLRAPLEHLVRNAVVHGIEPPEVRRATGKDVRGTVRLTAAIDGTELVLAIDDDGAGVDREAVRRRREAGGRDVVDTVDALQDVLCEPGFTTLDTVSAVGGRGLGLAAVGETLARLDGRLHLGTRNGLGTTVTCRLRQRIIVNQVVLVRCARRLYALPVNVVRRVGGGEGRTAARGTGARLSLLSLLGGVSPVAGREDGETDDTGAYGEGSAEISVETGERELVLEVDRVLGYRELLTQPLGPQLAALRCYAGGSVLSDGRQVLLVELERLLGEGARGAFAQGARARPDPETMRPVALVVDDSITLRVAAAGMLGRHGVETREARDGIEALDSLARALPQLMIVDIDMPRLGGFDLIRRVHERHGSRSPPIIVISSRDSTADRERARALGVVRYLTKPYTEGELHEALLASGLRLPDLTIA